MELKYKSKIYKYYFVNENLINLDGENINLPFEIDIHNYNDITEAIKCIIDDKD